MATRVSASITASVLFMAGVPFFLLSMVLVVVSVALLVGTLRGSMDLTDETSPGPGETP